MGRVGPLLARAPDGTPPRTSLHPVAHPTDTATKGVRTPTTSFWSHRWRVLGFAALLTVSALATIPATHASPVLSFGGVQSSTTTDLVIGLGSDVHGNLYLARVPAISFGQPCPGPCVMVTKLSPTGQTLASAVIVTPGPGTPGATQPAAPPAPASSGSGSTNAAVPVPTPVLPDLRPAFAVAPDGHVALAFSAHAAWPFAPTPATPPSGGDDAYVMVLDAQLATTTLATFIGGTQDDRPAALTFDAAGELYVVGQTTSSDFPLKVGTHAYAGDTSPTTAPTAAAGPIGRGDGFLAVLEPNGALAYATTLGGNRTDDLHAVSATDRAHVAVLMHSTSSLTGLRAAPADWGTSEVLTVLDTSSGATSATMRAPAGADGRAAGLALVPDGSMLVARNLPASSAAGRVQVLRIDAASGTARWQTRLGGSAADTVTALAARPNGDALVLGIARSYDFPTTPDAAQRELGGSQDLFAAVLGFEKGSIDYATLYGTSGLDAGIAVTPLWGCAFAVAGIPEATLHLLDGSSTPSAAPATTQAPGATAPSVPNGPPTGAGALLAIFADHAMPCTALPKVSSTVPCVNDAITFTVPLGADESDAVVSWDLGDGSSADGTTVTHAFHQTEISAVQATVSSSAGDRVVSSTIHPCLGLIAPTVDAGLTATLPPERAASTQADSDSDGVLDYADNCPLVGNWDQADADRDGRGDYCDATLDGLPPGASAVQQAPTSLANDRDRDGVADPADNCVAIPNREQANLDKDLLGDVCDLDMDGDGINDKTRDAADLKTILDNCAVVENPDQRDTDRDGVGDRCDDCPAFPDTAQTYRDTKTACPISAALPPVPAAGTTTDVAIRDNPVTLMAIVATVTVAAVGAVAWAGARLRRGLPILGLFGFSRLIQDQILEQPVRRQIMDLVTAQPGVHPQGLVRQLNLTRGAVEHHLRILEKAGHVRGKPIQGRVCYFAVGKVDVRVQPAAAVLRAPLAKQLIEEAMRDPGLSLTDLTARLGCSYGAMLYHVDRLEESGLVRRERRGGTVHLVPQTLGEQALAVVGGTVTRPVVEAPEFIGK